MKPAARDWPALRYGERSTGVQDPCSPKLWPHCWQPQIRAGASYSLIRQVSVKPAASGIRHLTFLSFVLFLVNSLFSSSSFSFFFSSCFFTPFRPFIPTHAQHLTDPVFLPSFGFRPAPTPKMDFATALLELPAPLWAWVKATPVYILLALFLVLVLLGLVSVCDHLLPPNTFQLAPPFKPAKAKAHEANR